MSSPLTREEKSELIKAAYNYNDHARKMASCNQLYMGTMATAMLFNVLGSKWPEVSLDDAITDANDDQLDAGLLRCRNILNHMPKKGKIYDLRLRIQ